MSALFASIPAMILLTGLLVAASGALLGTFLVLRGAAMQTDAISHAIVLGIVLVWMMTGARSGPVVVAGAALAGLATVLLSEALARSGRVRMDAAIGLVFPALFALGVLLINLNARNIHLDVHTVLLGEIGFVWLHTHHVAGIRVPVAVLSLGVVLALNAGFVALFWKELKLATFDPALAAAMGFAPALLFNGLLALTSATAVAAFDAVGAVMFIAFVIVPPATALLLTDRLAPLLAWALAIGAASVGLGYVLAQYWDVSIAGMMASAAGAFFALALVLAPGRGIVAQELRRHAQRVDADCRALVAHLHSHREGPERAEESTARALEEHLRWSAQRARRAILEGHDRGLLRREGRLLALTEAGLATARQMMAAGRPHMPGQDPETDTVPLKR
ncbi:MAG: metal ABC transporter permease [Rhodobacteraceae bacterium]|nr:metal ABC transporter permease [Paracoccaceae bacterium]